MTSDMIAKLINEDQIQILINLNGYTKVCFNLTAMPSVSSFHLSYIFYNVISGS